MSALQEKTRPRMGRPLNYGEAMANLGWLSRQEASGTTKYEPESLGRLSDLYHSLVSATPNDKLEERLTPLTEEDIQFLERHHSFNLGEGGAFPQLRQVKAEHFPSSSLLIPGGERAYFESIKIYDLCPDGDSDRKGMRLIALRGVPPKDFSFVIDFNIIVGWITDEEYRKHLEVIVDLGQYWD